jgi:ribonuclease P protein 3
MHIYTRIYATLSTALERDQVQWKIFKEWLGKFTEGMIDIIIDGANVGFYKQNFFGAPTHIEYRQVYKYIRRLFLLTDV